MEDCYHSGWPDGTNWPDCSFPQNNESSFAAPWQQPSNLLVSGTGSTSIQFHEFPPWSTPVPGFAEDRATIVSKSHSQAEKRRRDRINSQLAILRKLIPKSDKMDKAALLGTVIERVKDLKLKAMEISKTFTIPAEVDEVTVDCYPAASAIPNNIANKSKNNMLIKASVCCEDQPELFRELMRVLKELGLTIVRADIASVGGRIKSILVLCNKEVDQECVPLNTLKQSLHLLLNRMSSSSVASNCRIRSKRQRLFSPHHFSE